MHVACCRAWSAVCNACVEGVSVHEYCQSNPHIPGCKPPSVPSPLPPPLPPPFDGTLRMDMTLAGSLETFDEALFRDNLARVLHVANEIIRILRVVPGSVTVSFEVGLRSAVEAVDVQRRATELYLDVDGATRQLGLHVESIAAPVLQVTSTDRTSGLVGDGDDDDDDEEEEEEEGEDEDEDEAAVLGSNSAALKTGSDSGTEPLSGTWVLVGCIAGSTFLLLVAATMLCYRRYKKRPKQADVIISGTSIANVSVASVAVEQVEETVQNPKDEQDPPSYELPLSQPEADVTIKL